LLSVPSRCGEEKWMREKASHRAQHPPANRKLVLYFPSPVKGKVLASKPVSSPAINGLKLRAVGTGSKIGSESQPKCRQSTVMTVCFSESRGRPWGALESGVEVQLRAKQVGVASCSICWSGQAGGAKSRTEIPWAFANAKIGSPWHRCGGASGSCICHTAGGPRLPVINEITRKMIATTKST
jgi:hypothetical protein